MYLYNIKTFSNLVGINASTLRFWDNAGVFLPSERNENTKYRFYSQEQLITVNFIKVLSNLGVPLKKTAELEPERTPEVLLDLIKEQDSELNRKLKSIQEAAMVFNVRKTLIEQGVRAEEDTISVQRINTLPIVLGPQIDFEESDGFYQELINFRENAKALRINTDLPVGILHSSLEAFETAPCEPERFFSVDPFGNQSAPGGDYIVAYKRGSYGDFGDLPERINAFAKENKLSCVGNVYCVYLFDEFCVNDPSQYLLQASVRVKD